MFGDIVGCDDQLDGGEWETKFQEVASTPNLDGGISLLFRTLFDLLGFITGILVLTLIGQMVMRLFLFNFYTILAPLGIGARALGRPGESLTRLWLQGTFSTLF